MARRKKVVLQGDAEERRPIPQTIVSPAFPSAETIYPSNKWIEMKHNNSCINTRTYKCFHPIFLAIIENHPWKDLFTVHPQVPKVYLQQIWGTMKYVAANTPNQAEEYLACSIGDYDLELTVDQYRVSLGLPRFHDFIKYPTEDSVILQDVVTLGYNSDPNVLKLNWDHIPSHWQFLLQLMCHNLTHKVSGKDYATKRTLLIWTAFALNRKYDIAQILFDDLKDLVIKREQSEKKQKKQKKKGTTFEEEKRSYIPFQRFLQMLIVYTSKNAKGGFNPRHGDERYEIYETIVFKKRPNAIESSGLPIPEYLLNLIPDDDVRLQNYRSSLTPMGQSEPIVPSQGVLAPIPSEGLELGEGNDTDNDDAPDNEGGNIRMRVQKPVHTPVFVLASPTGIQEGGVEKIVSESEKKRIEDKRKRTSPTPSARHRGTTSTILSHSLTENIEQAVVSPATQTVETPPHYSRSPLERVSKSTGQSPHTLTSTHSEQEVIEKESQDPRLSPSFEHISSQPVTPFSFSLGAPISLSDYSGTAVGHVSSEHVQGSAGSPSIVIPIPAMKEGPSGDGSVPSPGVTTRNLRELDLPHWMVQLSKKPISEKGKGVADPVDQLRYHLDVAEQQKAALLSSTSHLTSLTITPSQPVTTSLPPVSSPSKSTKKSKKKSIKQTLPAPHVRVIPTTPGEYYSVKSYLKTLPRVLIEEVLMDMVRDAEPRTLRDVSIIDSLLLQRDVQTTHEEILKTQHEEMLALISRYRTYSDRCSTQAQTIFKRRHSDQDPDDPNPTEGEVQRSKRVKLKKMELMALNQIHQTKH